MSRSVDTSKRASGGATGLSTSLSKRASGGVPSSLSAALTGSKVGSGSGSGGASKSTTPATSTSSAKPLTAVAGVKKKPSIDATPTSSSTSSVTKGLSGLKVSSSLADKKSPPAPSAASPAHANANANAPTPTHATSSGENRRATAVLGRRRGDDDKERDVPALSTSASSSSPSHAPTSFSSSSQSSLSPLASAANAPSATGANVSASTAAANKARRRLSITANKDGEVSKVDGAALHEVSADPMAKVLKSMAAAANAQSAQAKDSTKAPAKRRAFSHYTSLSKVGFVPFNPNKVNQDRAVEIAKFGNSEDKAFFGVFDGHGALGHEVSAFLIRELPQFFLKQTNLESNPHEAISKAFIECNVKLASSAIDCTFSGSTAIVVYITNGKIYSCNAGDSRAVLAQCKLNAAGENKWSAVGLSSDQKPEREDEKKRILECKGRVEACKGLRGEDIGPPRVWLSHQDVPGLAMSRSFGDLIAASVGVIAKPEIWEREVTDQDKFIILASDGVWEFISNQEAVDIVVSAGSGGAEEAVKALVEEATKRWHAEEEVVDDITAVIVFL